MTRTLHLLELRIPFRQAFSNADSTLTDRQVLLIGVEEEGVTGWGEAAPYPGINTESTARLWDIVSAQPRLATGRVIETLPTTLAAAIDQAHHDLQARQAGLPMWQAYGGQARSVRATVAIGISPTANGAVSLVHDAVQAGFDRIKLKVSPGLDAEHISAVRTLFPEIGIAIDCNGSYQLADPLFDVIDEFSLDYVEQPFAAVRTGEHEVLRTRIETPVCLDESVHTERAAQRAIEEGAADLVALKAGLIGPTPMISLAELASAHDIGVKVSGLIETSVGRTHTRALGTLPGVDHVDLAPPRWFLADDVAPESAWSLSGGAIDQQPGAGLGFEIDQLALSGITERTLTESVG